MSLPAYERLRMAHRALAKNPPTRADLTTLLGALPDYLDEIARSRPALATEVAHSRARVEILRTATGEEPAELAEALHEILAPLFAG